jgi:hypothetical protein
MPDTTWEESQKRDPRFRLWIWLIIILLGVSLAGIIIYNNRDYIPGLKTPGSKTVSREVFSANAVSRAPRENPGIYDKAAVPSDERPFQGKQKHKNSAVGRDSVVIKDIACRVMDRNDIRIRLSVRLVFDNTGQRNEILVRRETMAVMVQKTLKTMSLEDVKIDKIKPVLLKEINTIYDNNVVNDIAIDNIIVEKVFNE